MISPALEALLRPYAPRTSADWLHAIREIVQELVLLGLWRSGFYEHAAFYGGTALRIFHGLNRFSEDLDFSLLHTDSNVRLQQSFASVERELAAWGFSFVLESKSKGDRSGIESAFLKGNTHINFMRIGVPDALRRHLPDNQKITIKLELDIRPPAFATTDVLTRLLPTPHQVRLYDLPSLFAGKLHALLYRGWKNRVKGRDFYDFVWYVSRGITVNLPHLEARIRQGDVEEKYSLTLDDLQRLLLERFEAVDISAAADEVRPFLRDPRELQLWSVSFFQDLALQVRGSGA